MRRLIVCVALWIGLCGCNTAPPLPPIVIGHVSDKTRLDKAGDQAELGLWLALNHLNKEGALSDALGGRKIEIRHTDTRGALDAYEAEAVRLVSIHRCLTLFGGLSPQETAALDQSQVPLLTFQGLPAPGASNQVFYLGMSPRAQGELLAKFVAADAKLRRLVLLADERRTESAPLLASFEKTLGEANSKSTPPMTLRFGNDVKWSELSERVRAQHPHAILFAGSAQDFNAWHQEYRREENPDKPLWIFAGDDGAARRFDLEPAGKAQVVLATAFLAESEQAQTFAKQFKEAFHTDADVHAALAYDGFGILAAALKRAQTPIILERLLEELKNTKDYAGLTGPLTVNADRSVQRPLFMARWQNGALTPLKMSP